MKFKFENNGKTLYVSAISFDGGFSLSPNVEDAIEVDSKVEAYLIECGCEKIENAKSTEYEKTVIDRAFNYVDEICKYMNLLVELFLESKESYELLNSIPNYPENWHSLDEEVELVEDYRNAIMDMIELE